MESLHTEVVVARFDQPADAREAMIDLEVKGIDADAINLGLAAPSVPTKEAARAIDLEMTGGTASRAVKGGVLGALAGATLMIAVLTMFRVEPLGQALLIGVVAGAIGGLFIGAYWGAVLRLPVNEDAFDTFAVDPAASGSIVVHVRVEDPRVAADAVSVLRRHHAQQIDREVA